MRMAATGDDGEYLQRHDQGVLGIPAAFFPYDFALEERPEGDQVEAAVAEELGYGGGPGALDMMQLDEIAYWLLDLHVLDPLFDDPHGGDGDDEEATASVSTITAEISVAVSGDHERMLLPAEIADWDNIDQWLLQVHHDLAADPHGDDDSTATSTAAAESWADGGGWEMQIDEGGDDDGEWVLRGHGADDAATASTAESRIRGDDHRLQPYAICDCAAAAGDLSDECWWVPEPEPTGPPPDQLALDGDVFLQDLVLGDMQQLLV